MADAKVTSITEAGKRVKARVAVIGPVEKASQSEAERILGASKSLPEDPFQGLYEAGANKVIRPPISLMELTSLWENNTILGQCIDAMAVNIEGFGHRFIPAIDPDEAAPEIKARMEVEHNILENFFEYASVEDPELSFADLRMRKRQEQEGAGNAWWEVMRNPSTGELMGFNQLPAHTCRLTLLSEPVETKQKLLFNTPDKKEVLLKERTAHRRFRMTVQIRGAKTVYFKAYGDPRIIDCRSGKEADETLDPKWRANEVIHFPGVWIGRSAYAVPRYIGNLFSIYGSRSAEEINFFTFENNNVPSMAVMVSNGMLTEGSVDRIKEFVESQFVGKKNYSQFLILESEPVGEGVANPGQMKLDIQPLVDQQHTDQLFQNYDKNNRSKVRGAFRLPPIFLGMTEDFNRATAEVSRRLADEQVFNPARLKFDNFMNRLILPDLGIRYWKFKSNTPDTTDNENLVRLLGIAEKTGGLTPQIARDIMSDIFSKDLGKVDAIDGNMPFSITLAQSMQSGGVPQSKLSVPGEKSTERALAKRAASLRTPALSELVELRKELEEVYQTAHDNMWDELDPLMPDDSTELPTVNVDVDGVKVKV